MNKTESSRPSRSTQNRLNAVVSHLTSVIVACGLLMWSVFNFWLNVLAFRVNEEPDQAWFVAGVLVFLTCVIPFLIGIRLLFKSLDQKKSDTEN